VSANETTAIDWPDNPLWNYALSLYARPGVAEACLALQERHGIDVNLVLCCCWAAAERRRLAEPDMRRLIDRVAAWHGAVVRPLRAVRRWLKPHTGDPLVAALRKRLAALEIETEHYEHIRLAEAAPGAPAEEPESAANLAQGNIATYFAVIGRDMTTDDTRAIERIVAAAFPAGASPSPPPAP